MKKNFFFKFSVFDLRVTTFRVSLVPVKRDVVVQDIMKNNLIIITMINDDGRRDHNEDENYIFDNDAIGGYETVSFRLSTHHCNFCLVN